MPDRVACCDGHREEPKIGNTPRGIAAIAVRSAAQDLWLLAAYVGAEYPVRAAGVNLAKLAQRPLGLKTWAWCARGIWTSEILS